MRRRAAALTAEPDGFIGHELVPAVDEHVLLERAANGRCAGDQAHRQKLRRHVPGSHRSAAPTLLRETRKTLADQSQELDGSARMAAPRVRA